jgi:membrane protein implicated in regulation of membrane protease activity
MSLEDFREPTTPESRMHRTVLALLVIGGIRGAVGAFVGWRYSVETAIVVLVAAITYAVWRYLRQPRDRSTRPISN